VVVPLGVDRRQECRRVPGLAESRRTRDGKQGDGNGDRVHRAGDPGDANVGRARDVTVTGLVNRTRSLRVLGATAGGRGRDLHVEQAVLHGVALLAAEP
jgi:hypothetical protein